MNINSLLLIISAFSLFKLSANVCIAERHSRRSLTWTQRIAAAVGIAKGLQFLHTVAGVYSNKIKITDVLLDQNLVAKISSYNLPLMAESMAEVQRRRFFFCWAVYSPPWLVLFVLVRNDLVNFSG